MKKIIYILTICLITLTSYSQTTLTNYGATISIFGSSNNNIQTTLLIDGSFENQNDGTNNGLIDINDFGHIFITGDWTNNSSSNVFSTNSTSLFDGLVTFENNTNIQVIGGNTPTFFENISLNGSRKFLSNDNSVYKTLILNAPLILDGNTFEIKNSNSDAISYKSGFIKSETLPGNHGYIKWNTANGIGLYSIPFGSDNGTNNDDLRFNINIKTPMGLSDYFTFATYPTDFFKQPMPSNYTPHEVDFTKIINRYWLIEPNNKSNLNYVDLGFTYTEDDYQGIEYTLDIDNLKAARNNTSSGQWLDMTPRGKNSYNYVEITSINPLDFYPTWTLLNTVDPLEPVLVPNAFTPNGDGINDIFIPTFHTEYDILEYEFIIYNRWGQVVFATKDQNSGWDGKPINSLNEPEGGIYSWVIILKHRTKGAIDERGIEKKFRGMATLIK